MGPLVIGVTQHRTQSNKVEKAGSQYHENLKEGPDDPRHTPTATSTWQLDPAHSSVEFAVKHMMMTTVRGRFKNLQATLTGDEDHPDGCCVEAQIEVASIDTGNPDRDKHLRSADFFDAERHPNITFRSKRVEGTPNRTGDKFQVIGDLIIRDTTSEITLDCVFEGRGSRSMGQGAGRLQRQHRN